MNVMIPLDPNTAGQAMNPKPPVMQPDSMSALSTAIRIWTLCFENPEIVAFIRDRLIAEHFGRMTSFL